MEKLTAKKSLGQNFLNSPRIPMRMVEAAKLSGDETVLEVGPGTGALTVEILKHAKKVIAVEADSRAMDILHEKFAKDIASGKLVLVHGDIREITPERLGLTQGNYVVIANIPYYISGFLFRYFLESDCQPSTLVFLTQKEVSERIARDTKESLLSLSIKVYAEPKYVVTVKRGNFSPSPKVDSAIIALYHIAKKNFTAITEEHFFELIHLGFAAKRKQLLGALAKKYPREQVQQALEQVGLRIDVRAEDVPLATWITLAEHMAK